MSKQDNLVEHLDTEVISVPPLDEPVNIVDRTSSKTNNNTPKKALHDIHSTKSIDLEDSITPSFSSCFSSSSNNTVTTANACCMNHVQTNLKKYMKKMH
eukprot:8676701-Ditylum_brightwellii.AAC.1